MKRYFVDTNYFLRFLLGDNLRQSEAATKLFMAAAKGEVLLASSVVVVFEVYWVLTDYYKIRNEDLAEKLWKVLSLSVDFENRGILMTAIKEMKGHSFDLEDSFNMNYALSLEVDEFKTFDKKLQRKFSK
ncbi:PIN domain-containing protein [Candidatus Collierbacteria bacterium]|nr:PIN domain-containing protein [Candidatus Collierbacteria bacterium]